MDAQLFGKNNDVVALSQPIHRHLAECPRVSPHSSLCHCSSFQLRSVPLESVSKLGFSPRHIGSTWCKLMHSDLMWPINGRYQCRRCHRSREITWAAQGNSRNSRLK